MINQYIDQILSDCKITDFLDERGIFPARKSSDKLIYFCPIHGVEKVPSFTVYPVGTKGRNYQTYHCFGCHSGINIINLKKDLDHVSSVDAITSFLADVKIDKKSVTDSIIADIQSGKLKIDIDRELEEMYLGINLICKRHLSACKDYEERELIEKIYKMVDEVVISRNIQILREIYNRLGDRLGLRVMRFNKKQDREEVSSLAWKI